ncbi:hypothetical protein COY13_01135 [Candidatus Roizmanbacteria bacterium CG_4_10_14_0_2_um_filter_36_35]|uniref:Uncharacterized protein n=4 Tax=Candidatus Roizmaniibacteriota TaxID=1752723 RepID=A0A2M7BXV5_9BACT|nr:MAG: hypothetical protein COV86_00730 [Candidatus Roizmanbacteria bacterium CG11_big_fil_rev_8_21_14_0_20_35_14]PIV11401.1 MAG: hypothetical protein COS50_00345 [Candidatus Roizmanbacteria bacterium CG03_land_8_20_14_0_80_35_26]PIZ68472.1 MAG: hypothetical protein COY13_01135 [Candidatus Roizmanbacteria bacterium CG_4_10_14_0_2_um_filter_36_35]PJC31260.1 MAG: hypothetical protein CO049_04455 [Candidatus Roizmanbacteria bacterium CG_4_9_14_0_2_um_filter_36_12]PJC80106.1 MAG: hypothetical prot
MEFNNIIDIFFKVSAILLAIIYLLYAIVVSKQVKIMIKTLEDEFNFIVSFISSLQITVALILLIFAIFLV